MPAEATPHAAGVERLPEAEVGAAAHPSAGPAVDASDCAAAVCSHVCATSPTPFADWCSTAAVSCSNPADAAVNSSGRSDSRARDSMLGLCAASAERVSQRSTRSRLAASNRLRRRAVPHDTAVVDAPTLHSHRLNSSTRPISFVLAAEVAPRGVMLGRPSVVAADVAAVHACSSECPASRG